MRNNFARAIARIRELGRRVAERVEAEGSFVQMLQRDPEIMEHGAKGERKPSRAEVPKRAVVRHAQQQGGNRGAAEDRQQRPEAAAEEGAWRETGEWVIRRRRTERHG